MQTGIIRASAFIYNFKCESTVKFSMGDLPCLALSFFFIFMTEPSVLLPGSPLLKSSEVLPNKKGNARIHTTQRQASGLVST